MYDYRTLILCASLLVDGDYYGMVDLISNGKEFVTKELLERAKNIKSKYITILDDDFPPILKEVYHPPMIIYYYGDISLLQDLKSNVAIIGSREPSTTVVINTVAIAKQVVTSGYNVVSGLAYGVDYHAQNTAVLNGGKAIAVLGGGIDNCYPKVNYKLYEEIKRTGLVISEYPENSEPKKDHFPYRNRLISALCDKIIVVEAKRHSGTSTTVAWALTNIYRDILCVPAPFGEDSLCNALIRDGCGCIATMEDLQDELPPKKS